MEKMKVYISGPISGLPMDTVKEAFDKAATDLRIRGFEPISPLEVSPQDSAKQWDDYMMEDLEALRKCQGILMLEGWEESCGAWVERLFAQKRGMFEVVNMSPDGASDIIAFMDI